MDFERTLGGKVLRDVSRSFFLSLRVLPNEVRGTCSLAYLLARTSDTLADTAVVKLPVRKDLLLRFRSLIQDRELDEAEVKKFETTVHDEVLPSIDHKGENQLMRRISGMLDWLNALSESSRESVEQVLDSITTGQLEDLQRFGESEPGKMRFLMTSDELSTYADHVAGSVGRFWTELGSQAFPNFSDVSVDSMQARGQAYGRGLQYLNIVRDLGDDVKMGRCYLPKQELEFAGWEDGPWNTNQGALMNVATTWLNHAEEGLREGLDYSQRLLNRRMKLATVLPAMIGAATIRALRKSQSSFLTRKIKVDRTETRRISMQCTQKVLFGQKLEPYFNQLLRGGDSNLPS
tara:strand:+ start:25631 stop:26674 length:1044 start_codon:yes stop_codon:yes gene_type:complete